MSLKFCLKILPQRFSCFSMVYYCHLPVTNPVMVILQIMFIKAFLVTGLVWHYLFLPIIRMRAFIVVSSSTTFCQGTTMILLSANPTFYQIYYYFRITVKFDKLRLNVYFYKYLFFSCYCVIDREVFFHCMVGVCLPH